MAAIPPLHLAMLAAAERIGVFAEPEVVTKQLNSQHPFLVIASDGVWEFLTSQSVIDMVRAWACLEHVVPSLADMLTARPKPWPSYGQSHSNSHILYCAKH
jgi:serine/threonine protein phosphatase PrpC